MSAPVSDWIVLMTLPLGPITSPTLSIGMISVVIFGAVAATSVRGAAIAAFITSRISRRATLACLQGRRQHVGRDAVDLRVELQAR